MSRLPAAAGPAILLPDANWALIGKMREPVREQAVRTTVLENARELTAE